MLKWMLIFLMIIPSVGLSQYAKEEAGAANTTSDRTIIDYATWASNIESVTATDATEAEDDGSLGDSDIAAGSIIFVDLPTTHVKFLQMWGTYYIKAGD